MLRRPGWITATLTIGLLLSSIFRSTGLTVSLAVLVLCALAVARPANGLLVAMGFAGLGNILRVFAGISTLRVEEIIVLSALFGWCARSASDRTKPASAPAGFDVLTVWLLALTVLCSAFVWMRVDQVRTEYGSTYLAELGQWLVRRYFTDSASFADVASTAAFVESLALYLAVASICRRDSTFFDRGVRMLAVGAAAVGAMSVVRLVEIGLRNPAAIHMLQQSSEGLRISPQIPDYIAAASYFSLCWMAALGLAVQRRADRVLLLITAVPVLAGLYLTGSRSAIGAAVCGLAAFGWLITRRRRIAGAKAVIGVALAAVVALAVAFPKLVGHDLVGTTAAESMKMRVELLKVGASVVGTHPLFGVGLNRFFLYADRFASPQLLTMWYGRKNPHDDFLRMATEFGLVGLTLFLCVLLACARRIATHWSTRGDVRLAGLVGGLVAFLVTMIVSNPLMVQSVSYVFWMALGLAVGQATAQEAPRAEHVASTDESKRRRNDLIAWAVAVVVLVSVPFRADGEVATLDLSGVTYGLSDWRTSADGTPSRLAGARATIFVRSDAKWVDVALRSGLPAGGPQTVRAVVDGRLANSLTVGRSWQHLTIRLPPNDTRRSWRIDLYVAPTFRNDQTTFGAEVGAVDVFGGTPRRR